MRIQWFSASPEPGEVTFGSGTFQRSLRSSAEPTRALELGPWERQTFAQGRPCPPLFRHSVLLQGLMPSRRYEYQVKQAGQSHQSHFHTAPDRPQAIRFVAYSDSETEPESTGARVQWDNPAGPGKRPYLVDQTEGYAANLEVIRQSRPDFILLAGDLVETGGEQRDWDEFWKHNRDLADHIPLVAVPGNHEYYAGPQQGHYASEASEKAMDKFMAYFRPSDQRRYFSMEYGPVTVIGLDVCNGSPHQSEQDTNFHLADEGSKAPDFHPGSIQYEWLEEQLKRARSRTPFVIVTFHHTPYSHGVHGLPPGTGPGQDKQSGRPTRALLPLLMKYRVEALITGHDEMWERSEIPGVDEAGRSHLLQLWDVGTSGDGLRGPRADADNPHVRFLVHRDSPERWEGSRLIDGGKHYGHLEVEIVPHGKGWKASFLPVYVFPVTDEQGKVERFERRVYPDVVEILR